MELIKVKKVDDKVLKEIVDKIVAEVHPEKIILFGSYAYGAPHRGSDLDLLLVINNIKGTKRKIRLKIRKLLRKYLIPKDILVVNQKEIEEWKNVPQAFVTSIIKKGKVLYEK